MPYRLPLVLVLLCLLVLLPGCGGEPTYKASHGKPQHIAKTAKRQATPATASGVARATTKKTGTQKPYVINGVTYTPIASAQGYRERGIASWYGEPFHGRRTANGEIYDMHGDTAAHKTLPMNTMLLVRNLDNGRSTVVRVNDRGPFVRERIIDLSRKKAEELGVLAKGTARVEIVALAADSVAAPASAVAQTQTRQESQKSAARPPDFDHGNFFVQVGAFERVEEARALAKKFAKLGRDVVIQQYPAAGMDLYRVLVFASHSLREARQYEAKMRASGFKYTLLLAR